MGKIKYSHCDKNRKTSKDLKNLDLLGTDVSWNAAEKLKWMLIIITVFSLNSAFIKIALNHSFCYFSYL